MAAYGFIYSSLLATIGSIESNNNNDAIHNSYNTINNNKLSNNSVHWRHYFMYLRDSVTFFCVV